MSADSIKIREFIAGYNPTYRERINFAWNQKHGGEFEDANSKFRLQVIESVIATPEQAALNLLHDLFEAEARWSKEAWCIREGFAKMGALILTRGGIESFDHFLAWFTNSFDSFSECHTMQLDPMLVDTLLQEINNRLLTTPKGAEKSHLEIAKMLFEKLKKGNATQGWVKFSADTKIENVRVVSKYEIWFDKIRACCLYVSNKIFHFLFLIVILWMFYYIGLVVLDYLKSVTN